LTALDTYHVTETKAPAGYQINTDFHPTLKLAYDSDGTAVLTWKDVCAEDKVPPAPSSPSVPSTPAPKSGIPKTGDTSNPLLWIGLAAAALAVSAILYVMHRKKEKEEADEADSE